MLRIEKSLHTSVSFALYPISYGARSSCRYLSGTRYVLPFADAHASHRKINVSSVIYLLVAAGVPGGLVGYPRAY